MTLIRYSEFSEVRRERDEARAEVERLRAVIRRIPEWYQQRSNAVAQCVLCTGYKHEGHYGDCWFAR